MEATHRLGNALWGFVCSSWVLRIRAVQHLEAMAARLPGAATEPAPEAPAAAQGVDDEKPNVPYAGPADFPLDVSL